MFLPGYRRCSTFLALVGSPVVVVLLLLMVSLIGLWSLQTHTRQNMAELATAVSSLNKGQQQLLIVQDHVAESLRDLEDYLRSQQESLHRVDRFTRQRNLIVSGIPERDDENVESMVRELFLKKLGISFENRDIEEVKRFGRKIHFPSGGEGRKIKVRLLNFQDKEFALEQSKTFLRNSSYAVDTDVD